MPQLDAARSREPLATFWRPSTTGISYARCHLPARYLPGKVVYIEDVIRGEGENVAVDRRALTLANATVWSIPGARTEGRLMEACRAMDIPAFVEVDDNYLLLYDGPGAGAWRAELNADDWRSVEAHKLILRHQASGVICATERLAELYSEHHQNVHVCENTVAPEDWPQHPFDLKPSAKDGVIRVGFAGSPSHERDLELIRKAMLWCAKQPNVEVVMIGRWGAHALYLPHEGTVNAAIDPGFPCRVIPWTDNIGVYHFNLCEIDVGLAPIVDSSWAAGKSDLKCLEYALAGVCPVVSDAVAYRPWRGTDVPMCATANDFLRTVQELVADPEGAREIALKTRQKVLAERTTYANIGKWKEALASA